MVIPGEFARQGDYFVLAEGGESTGRPMGGATSVLFKKLLERFQKTNTDNIPAAGLSALIVTVQQVMDDHLQVVLDSIPTEEKNFILNLLTSQTEKMRSERKMNDW